jgi:hypothetical protein
MKIFISIHESKGELDWIAPFLTDSILANDTVDIYLHNIEKSNYKIENIIKDYDLDKNNINIFKFDNKNHLYIKKFENISSKLLSFSKENSFFVFSVLNWVINIIINFLSLFQFIGKSYDLIFRDYNLKDTVLLNSVIKHNPQAKIVVFPHAFGIQRLPNGAKPKVKQRKVKCDLWLENTNLSTRSKAEYSKCFFACGSPIVSINYKKTKAFSVPSNNVLILLRDGYERYGCSDENALKKFKKVLKFLYTHNYNVYIKTHPRKSNIQNSFYREIEKYSNIKLFNNSLINLNKNFTFCLTFYSTAGLLLTSLKVPVFDITEYRGCHNKKDQGSLTHFCWRGNLSHFLLYFGIQDVLFNLNELLDKNFLIEKSENQYKNMKTYYPNNTSQKIYNKLCEVLKIDIH